MRIPLKFSSQLPDVSDMRISLKCGSELLGVSDSVWRRLQAELVVLGGAFFTNGNVNPAAEANVFGDPEAADLVLGGGANVRVVGAAAPPPSRSQRMFRNVRPSTTAVTWVHPASGCEAAPQQRPSPLVLQ